MRLKIIGIRDQGNLEKERVVLKAQSTGDIGRYLLAQSGQNENSITSTIFDAFWFPDKSVEVGDFVVVYTKAGTNSEKPFKQVKSHFFYWGKKAPIWNHERRAAVIFEAAEWDSFRPEITSEPT